LNDLPLLFPLPDQIPNGLRINGNFGIKVSGDIYIAVLNLVIANESSEPVSDFQIKFNKNIYQIGPDEMDPNLIIQPGRSSTISLNCSIGSVPTTDIHTELIQVALKSSLGFCVFESCLPLSLVLIPEGNLEFNEFMQMWNTIVNSNVEFIGHSLYQEPLAISNVLERYNIFVVNNGIEDDKVSLFISAKIGVDDTILLMQLQISNNCRLIIKSDVPEYVQLMKDVVMAVLTQQH